jgi:hypothetical protein
MDYASIVSGFNLMLLEFSAAFTKPTAETFRQLALGWLLTPHPGPVTGMIRALGDAATKHWTVYEKFFYRAPWSLTDLSRLVLLRLIAPLLGPRLDLNLDDTTCGPRGKHVALAGWFKDHSAHGKRTVIHWAHQWLIGAVTVRLPAAPLRRLALPVLFALYRKRADCDRRQPYATLPQLALKLVAQLAQWLPDRRIFVAGDGLYACREFFGRLPPNVAAVSRLRKNAVLRRLPPESAAKGRGRRRRRGLPLGPLQTLARPAHKGPAVTLLKQGRKVRRRLWGLTCQWYHVCRARPVRVVFAHDPTGHEDDLVVVCNDPTIPDGEIVQRYFDRWGIEECIEEAKQQLGLERTRGWCRRTVSRQAPLALLFSTLTKLWFVRHGAGRRELAPEPLPWYGHKRGLSFRDMLAALRLAYWHWRLSDNLHSSCQSHKILEPLAYALCRAA